MKKKAKKEESLGELLPGVNSFIIHSQSEVGRV